MTHHRATLEGDVAAVFAHRFVVKTQAGLVLADLGPGGAGKVRLEEGDHVVLTGEQKPSELKVHSIAKDGGAALAIAHPARPAHGAPERHDPAAALETVAANGFTVLGQPRRKPKHFEILGRDAGGQLVALHLDLGGKLRKTQPITAADRKWAPEISAAMA